MHRVADNGVSARDYVHGVGRLRVSRIGKLFTQF